jgi:uncharacterized protein (UPF0264 family)
MRRIRVPRTGAGDPSTLKGRFMTKLLVSVRDAEEADKAIRGGVDLIDVKEPRRGALGPAELEVWNSVRQRVDGHCPLSVALGELLVDNAARRATQTAGFHYAKIGLSGCRHRSGWQRVWQLALDKLPPRVAAVAVVYADAERASAPAPQETLRCAIDFGCRALLVDTHSKTGVGLTERPGLFDFLPPTRLAPILDRAREANMCIVLGGSLTRASLPAALDLEPDYVAVRGAACRDSRQGDLDTSLIRELANCLIAARPATATTHRPL